MLNDLEVVQVVNGDVFNVFEYRVTPIEQAILGSEGGMLAGVMYRNVGIEDQTNVEALVEVFDDAGNEVSATSASLGTVFTFANAANCPANAQDTLYIATGWEPTATGTYTLQITLDRGFHGRLSIEQRLGQRHPLHGG